MDELRGLLEEILNIDLRQIVLSNSRDESQGAKCKVRPVAIGGKLLFQETLYKGEQVFHQNFPKEEMAERIAGYLDRLFKQGEFSGEELSATVLVSKKGKMTVKKKRVSGQGGRPPKNLSHNREKQYILMDGTPVDFLIGLGVQTPDGRVTKNRYDKFRQINRFLEFIEDVADTLPTDRTIRIVDFGCGKSYLTFAMYYYLHELKGVRSLSRGLT